MLVLVLLLTLMPISFNDEENPGDYDFCLLILLKIRVSEWNEFEKKSMLQILIN